MAQRAGANDRDMMAADEQKLAILGLANDSETYEHQAEDTPRDGLADKLEFRMWITLWAVRRVGWKRGWGMNEEVECELVRDVMAFEELVAAVERNGNCSSV